MQFSSKSQIFAILFAILIFVLLFFARIKPDKGDNNSDVQLTVNEAVALIQKGEQPMKGILALREIAERDPKNEEAQMYLGVFSVQSNQLDKAIGRFEKVIEINPNNIEAFKLLAEVYIQMEDTSKCISTLEKAYSIAKDDESKEEINKKLEKFKNI